MEEAEDGLEKQIFDSIAPLLSDSDGHGMSLPSIAFLATAAAAAAARPVHRTFADYCA